MITLDDYQVESFKWLLASPYRILADEPGVGKTHPSIFAARTYTGSKLIVVPAYLKTNWATELEASGEDDYIVVAGPADEKTGLLLQPSAWTIVSYEIFTSYVHILMLRRFSVVVFDEAHRLKTRDSKRTKAAHAFRKFTERMFFLTGTPIISNGGDVFPLLKLCDPKKYSSYWTFVEDNCRVSVTPWGKKVGKPRNKESFYELLRPHMLRRTLESVFPDMPPVVYQDIIVETGDRVRKHYEIAKKDYLVTNPDGRKTRIGAGGLVTALRRLTSQSKDESLLGLLEDIPEEEQVVIFAWYRESVEHLLEITKGVGFHGGIADREGIIEKFKSGESRVLVATLSTMKEGVNLQNARHVIFYEEDWIHATNEQAVARLHRRGQKGTVLCYNIIVRKTIDEKVHRSVARRKAMSLEDVFDEVWYE